MCGICGINWNDPELIDRMTAVITHRGPDQQGVFCAPGISLGHRRLSIIDLSEQGRQPMTNEDGTIQLVFNGEIYNFQSLRERLLAQGHRFASHTDSEVLIHAYEAYGTDFLAHLQGMFALALWDVKRQRLFLARDRIGIKPLYYTFQDGRFLFASEIKSILECPLVSRAYCPQALYDYLGFEFVPAPETLFQGIHKLPAGHWLMLENNQLKQERYWELDLSPSATPLTYPEAVESLREHLDRAVKSHLISDVPLGVFLSGGLDSSAIVAMMRRHISGPLRTFTIGYTDKSYSELDYAQQVADVFGTQHQVLMIDNLTPDYVEKTLWHLDEPMTDLSAVPLYLVCQQARSHITVCLSGEGGDESFAGYDRFKASRLNRAFTCLPAPLRALLLRAAGILPDQPAKKGAINMLKRFAEGAALPAEGAHLRWQYFLHPALAQRLFKAEWRASVNADPFSRFPELMARSRAVDSVNQEIFLDMRFMMTDSVLMKVDKMSMASSMEVRVPLLDHLLVEYVASLPGSWKLRGFRTKHIFRDALQGILPDNIVNRGKQGYSLPVKHLLRKELLPYMRERIFASPLIQDTMHTAVIEELIQEHTALRHNHNHILWALLNLAIWDQRFLQHR